MQYPKDIMSQRNLHFIGRGGSSGKFLPSKVSDLLLRHTDWASSAHGRSGEEGNLGVRQSQEWEERAW